MQQVSCVLIENSVTEADAVQRLLQQGKEAYACKHVKSLAAFSTMLQASAPADVILLDLSLPEADGVEAVIQCRALGPNVPIVALAEHDDMDLATRVLAAGSQDCLAKTALDARTLGRTVRHAIVRFRLEQKRTIAEARMSSAIEGGKLGVWDWLLSDDTFTGSTRYLAHLGFTLTIFTCRRQPSNG
ncbi:MAG: response regulator [Halomonas sp.]|nr:response regulator [Halomonas sp.]MDN6297967.1 response regulator [Halomonas sp.]MDN6314603.1 response regulator [Halomonas sp.]MDN6336546.1 response regulator [Halomonas sp.]